jgi:hypothetical protein
VREGEIQKLAKLPNLERIIDFERGVIEITRDIAKVRCERKVKIRPALRQWLTAYPTNKYPILPKNHDAMISEVRRKCGLVGKDDVLRHTFISMNVSAFRSVGDAAIESGNSETIIKRHYLNLTTEAEAGLFWQITPEHFDDVFPWESLLDKIEKKKAEGQKQITPEEIMEDAERWGRAEMEDTLYRRHEQQGWREDYPGQVDEITRNGLGI